MIQLPRHEPFLRRQRSEQYLTSSQCFAHFRRQANGRPHVAHGFVGKSPFLTIFGMCHPPLVSQATRRYTRWLVSSFSRNDAALAR